MQEDPVNLMSVALGVGILCAILGLGIAAARAERRRVASAQSRRQAETERLAQLANARDPRTAQQREANECRYCRQRAVLQQPRVEYPDPAAATAWDRIVALLFGPQSHEPFVRTTFDGDYPRVLCVGCASLARSGLDAALATATARVATARAELVRDLADYQERELPARLHESLEAIRATQESFTKRGRPPAPVAVVSIPPPPAPSEGATS